MGTSYTLYAEGLEDSPTISVSIEEMSNKLQLAIVTQHAQVETNRMDPEEMLRLLLEGVKATSYWMDKDSFYTILNTLETYPY